MGGEGGLQDSMCAVVSYVEEPNGYSRGVVSTGAIFVLDEP